MEESHPSPSAGRIERGTYNNDPQQNGPHQHGRHDNTESNEPLGHPGFIGDVNLHSDQITIDDILRAAAVVGHTFTPNEIPIPTTSDMSREAGDVQRTLPMKSISQNIMSGDDTSDISDATGDVERTLPITSISQNIISGDDTSDISDATGAVERTLPIKKSISQNIISDDYVSTEESVPTEALSEESCSDEVAQPDGFSVSESEEKVTDEDCSLKESYRGHERSKGKHDIDEPGESSVSEIENVLEDDRGSSSHDGDEDMDKDFSQDYGNNNSSKGIRNVGRDSPSSQGGVTDVDKDDSSQDGRDISKDDASHGGVSDVEVDDASQDGRDISKDGTDISKDGTSHGGVSDITKDYCSQEDFSDIERNDNSQGGLRDVGKTDSYQDGCGDIDKVDTSPDGGKDVGIDDAFEDGNKDTGKDSCSQDVINVDRDDVSQGGVKGIDNYVSTEQGDTHITMDTTFQAGDRYVENEKSSHDEGREVVISTQDDRFVKNTGSLNSSSQNGNYSEGEMSRENDDQSKENLTAGYGEIPDGLVGENGRPCLTDNIVIIDGTFPVQASMTDTSSLYMQRNVDGTDLVIVDGEMWRGEHLSGTRYEIGAGGEIIKVASHALCDADEVRNDQLTQGGVKNYEIVPTPDLSGQLPSEEVNDDDNITETSSNPRDVSEEESDTSETEEETDKRFVWIVKPDDVPDDKVRVIKKRARKKRPILECGLCGKTFERPARLLRHTRAAHTGVRPFKCTQCDKSYTDKFILKRHMRKHDGTEPPKVSKKKKVPTATLR